MLNMFVAVYLDDILIYSQNEKEHLEHIEAVLKVLREHQLYAKVTKCEFFKTEINYLGHVIKQGGIHVDPKKIQDIQEWPRPTSLTTLQSLLGLTGYYRKFIKNYTEIATPLTNLTKKGTDVKKEWTDLQEQALEKLKKALSEAPILRSPDLDLPMEVTTDASGYAIGAVLSQENRPIAFYSRKMSPAEVNYPVHEQELLAIVATLKEWRHYLLGRKFTVYTDHQSITYFKTQPMLSRRQARWSEWLAEFDYDIKYKPGKEKNHVRSTGCSREPEPRMARGVVVP